MMLRVNHEYLDFNDLVEVEKQVKLLEEIETTDGDFSYAFTLPWTINNIVRLGNPQPDNMLKPVYQRIQADLLNDSGAEILKGYIRIEKLVRDRSIQCSFFAGNNNWFGLLAGNLRDLDWSEFDIDLSESSISAAILKTEGVVFPLIDNGMLSTRGIAQLKIEDFVPGIFVKTVFQKIFQAHGIKIQGELFDSVDFQNAITVKSAKDDTLIENASVYAGKTATTARPVENTDYKITFDTVSMDPYYMGSLDIFDLGTDIVTMPFKMTFDIDVTLKPSIVDASYNNRIYLYINGVFTFVDIGLASGTGGLYNSATPGSEEFFTIKRTITLNAGDTLEVYSDWQQSTGATQNDVLSGSIKITPKYVYSIAGGNVVPDWTQQEYVSQILRIFNVIPSYSTASKVLTLNLFEKIAFKQAIDISPYITSTEVDFVEFVSAYGQNSLLTMGTLEETDEFRLLNLNTLPPRDGVIEIDNGFLEDSKNIIESAFVLPITYVNPNFDMSMDKTDLITMSSTGSTNITSVEAGTLNRPRIHIEDPIFLQSDIIRIRQSTNPAYLGDWLVFAVDATNGWIEIYGVEFDTDATGEVDRMQFDYKGSEAVYLMRYVNTYSVPKLSSLTSFRLEATDYETTATAFSRLINMGRQVNQDFKYSMSFDGGDYQVSLTEQYFRLIGKVLNDPVKLFCEAYLPLTVYNSLNFLSPVSVQTEETQNRYYINRISGYKDSFYPCVIELIKL